MATLKQIRDKADAKLTTFWQLLQPKQEAYFAKHDKYFQLIISPDNPVIDGVDSTFNVKHPHDEVHQIDVDFPWTDQIPFQIEVHTGSKGDKATYTAQVRVTFNGTTYFRSRSKEGVDTGWITDPIQ